MLNQSQIRALIPHAGSMCLLETVARWDDAAIECRSRSHGDPDNPLRHAGRIGAVCGIEYCLQAMAVHGALIAAAAQPVGYLVRVGDARFDIEFLDELGAELVARAELMQSLDRGYSYRFSLTGDDPRRGLQGRATIALVG